MVIGIEHVAIASHDIKKLAQWYIDALGFWINYDSGQTLFLKAPNGSMIEIIPAQGLSGPQTLKDPGFRHLAIAVSDFDGVYDRLKAMNTQFVSEPVVGKGFRVVFFTDLDGNYLHLIQRETPLP